MRWKKFLKKKPKQDGWYYCTVDTGFGRACKVMYWNADSKHFRNYTMMSFAALIGPETRSPYVIYPDKYIIAWTKLPKPYSRRK